MFHPTILGTRSIFPSRDRQASYSFARCLLKRNLPLTTLDPKAMGVIHKQFGATRRDSPQYLWIDSHLGGGILLFPSPNISTLSIVAQSQGFFQRSGIGAHDLQLLVGYSNLSVEQVIFILA